MPLDAIPHHMGKVGARSPDAGRQFFIIPATSAVTLWRIIAS